MITTGFAYIAVLFVICGGLALLESTKHRFFNVIPGIVILYFVIMLLSTFGLWEKTNETTAAYKAVKDNLLPAMIFLLLLKGDLRQIAALGPKMIFTFIIASVSIGLGFVLTFLALAAWLPQDAWMTFAPLSGSWLGGGGNMAAVQGALDIPDSSMTNALLMDSIDYAIWVVLLLAFVPLAPKFNKWTKSSTKLIDEVGAKLEAKAKNDDKIIDTSSLLFLIGLALGVSALSQYLADYVLAAQYYLTQFLAAAIPVLDVSVPATLNEFLLQDHFLNAKTWRILIATVFGTLAAMTRIGKMAGSSELGNVLLYGIVALIASRANFAELNDAPLFVLAGFMILAFHGMVMVSAAKLFRLDLFSCGVASLANIGGVASAPILAAAYSRALIPIGVLMALLGYIIGTGGGLLIGKILLSLS